MKKVIAVVVIVLVGVGIVATIRGYRPGNVLGSLQNAVGAAAQQIPGRDEGRPAQAELTGKETEHIGFGAGAGEQPAQAEQPPGAPQEQVGVELLDQVQKYADVAHTFYDRPAQSGVGQRIRQFLAAIKIPFTDKLVEGGISLSDLPALVGAFLVLFIIVRLLAIPTRRLGRDVVDSTLGWLINPAQGAFKSVRKSFLGGNLVTAGLKGLGLFLLAASGWVISKSPVYTAAGFGMAAPGWVAALFICTVLLILTGIISFVFSAFANLLKQWFGLFGTIVVAAFTIFAGLNAVMIFVGGLHTVITGTVLDTSIYRYGWLIFSANVWQKVTGNYNWMIVMGILGAVLYVMASLIARLLGSVSIGQSEVVYSEEE